MSPWAFDPIFLQASAVRTAKVVGLAVFSAQ